MIEKLFGNVERPDLQTYEGPLLVFDTFGLKLHPLPSGVVPAVAVVGKIRNESHPSNMDQHLLSGLYPAWVYPLKTAA